MAAYQTYTDMELLELLRNGDETAFREIYARYWEKLFYRAGKKLQNLPEAENIVQDIFLDIWQRRHELQVTGTFSHYLALALKYRIINFQARLHHKNNYQSHLANRQPGERTTEEWLAYSDLNRRMSGLVAGLPEKCQLAFRLRQEGMSQKEIAHKMGVSENTVETHIGRALKILRTGLTQLFSFL